MKILCLPGGLCNGKTMKAQLMPIIDQFRDDDSISFQMVQGNNQVTVPPEYAGFFGPPPNFTFVAKDVQDFFTEVRKIPKTGDAGESMRLWRDAMAEEPFAVMETAVNNVLDLVDADPEIGGILGYSEGSWVSVSVVAEEISRKKKIGQEPQLKLGVFIGGFPPAVRETGQVVTEAEVGQMIDIHTIHVIGTNDPYIDGGTALYDVCNPDKAEMFGHAGGHVIPRDISTLNELAEVMKEAIQEINDEE